MQIGKLDLAAVELKKAVALRPDNGDAWAILGSTLKQDSRFDEARDALERAIPLLPGQPGRASHWRLCWPTQASTAATAADASEAAGEQQQADQQRSQAKNCAAKLPNIAARLQYSAARRSIDRRRHSPSTPAINCCCAVKLPMRLPATRNPSLPIQLLRRSQPACDRL